MAKIYTWRALADGRLPAATAALYTVPANAHALIKTITLTNTAAAIRTINLYMNTSGVNRRIMPENMSMEANWMFVYNDELTLEPGDSIQGDASVAACVDFAINGMEET